MTPSSFHIEARGEGRSRRWRAVVYVGKREGGPRRLTGKWRKEDTNVLIALPARGCDDGGMLDPHVHCAECQSAIETTVIARGGKRKPRTDLGVGVQNRLVPTSEGVAVVQVKVPLCPECLGRVQKLAEEQKAKSRLIVPSIEAARRARRGVN